MSSRDDEEDNWGILIGFSNETDGTIRFRDQDFLAVQKKSQSEEQTNPG